MAGGRASLCTMAPVCGRVPILEYDGNVYTCDHFVDTKHCLGNIMEQRSSELLELPEQKAFGLAKRQALPNACQSCPWLNLCNGGCLKDRYSVDGRYDLCESMQIFYAHAVPYLQEMMAMSRRRMPNSAIMAAMRARLKKEKR